MLQHSQSWGSQRTSSRKEQRNEHIHSHTAPRTPTSSAFRFTGPGSIIRTPKTQGLKGILSDGNHIVTSSGLENKPRVHRSFRSGSVQKQVRVQATKNDCLGDRKSGAIHGMNVRSHQHSNSPSTNDRKGSGEDQLAIIQAEVEREDALDFLACLVERSIAYHEKVDVDDCSYDEKKEGSEPTQPSVSIGALGKQKSNRSSDFEEAVASLRRISWYDINDTKRKKADVDKPNHQVRMGVLDELLRSHTYALEMERAALSASAWLRAIGRGYEGKTATVTDEIRSNEATSVSNIGLKSITAQLRTAEMKAKDNFQLADRLNEELSKCRAEIGRLKSASRAENLYISPNKSIFDVEEDSDDDSETSSSFCSNSGLEELETALKDVSTIGDISTDLAEDEAGDRRQPSQTNISEDMVTCETASAPKKETIQGIDSSREVLLLKASLQKALLNIKRLEKRISNDDEANTSINDELTGDKYGSNTKCVQNTPNKDVKKTGYPPNEFAVCSNKHIRRAEKDRKEKEIIVNAAQRCKSDDMAANDFNINVGRDDLSENFTYGGVELSISDPSLEKELEKYTNAIRKTDKAKIDYLKRKLDSPKDEVVPQALDPSRDLPRNSDKHTINVCMLDGENFVTEWDELAPLPPPPDHGLRSPIVEALLTQWTPDQDMQHSFLSWMDRILEGADPSTIPPLKISSLDHQLRDGFKMHVLPLLLRRSDIHIEVTSRAHRRTSYDMAVSVTKAFDSGNGAVSNEENVDQPLGKRTKKNITVRNPSSRSTMHMMAFKASLTGTPMVDEVDDDNFSSRDQSRLGQSEGSGSAANSSIITSRASNRMLIGDRKEISSELKKKRQSFSHRDAERIIPDNGEYPAGIAVGSSGGADEYSVGSSITGASSHKCANQLHQNQQQQQHPPGLMSTLGGAFGGLLWRKTEPDSQQKIMYDDDQWGGSLPMHTSREEFTQSQHNRPSHNYQSVLNLSEEQPIQSPAVDEEAEQPYHRVVSAPPGRIGITFVQYRGHAMVSDVSPESPLSGWIFPSDILIAIDEIPVSGLRVREIVRILTSRKERQRALRLISSHAMNELTQDSSGTIER